MKRFSKIKSFKKLYKNLQSIYTLTEIEQEALHLCLENGKDYTHIVVIIDVILDKFKRTLEDFEETVKNC